MSANRPDTISDRFLRPVLRRVAEGRPVRRNLPVWGRLAIDRPLPFLCAYRRPIRKADPDTFRLATSEASYLTCTHHRGQKEGIGHLVAGVLGAQARRFGSALLLEIWAGTATPAPEDTDGGLPGVGFRIHAPREDGYEALTDKLEEALHRIRIGRRRTTVTVTERGKPWPRGRGPLLPPPEAARLGCHSYGLEIDPIYRDPANGIAYPRILREFRRKLSIALRRFFYEFSCSFTKTDPAHFHVLGRRAVVRAVWEVDRILADAAESYEFLLQLTPVNGEQAWHRFRRSKYEKIPALHYRPVPVDPVVLKRQLYTAPVERIEDPALALVFRQKLDEIDRQITMLGDRNTRRFLPESVQLYGGVEDGLNDLALDLLSKIPRRSREAPSGPHLDAEAFARRARDEIEYLRTQWSQVAARVEVRSDVTGLLVSRGTLLVSAHSRIPASRAEALIQHEVGTHVLTYQNGRAQKLRHLSVGLAGYDALQEGLAVLSEYLVGGLSRPRLRLLAGRVVAARSLLDGATFVETWRLLHRVHGFPVRTAFTITVRTHRSGGLTKDSVYLRGLVQILEYLARGSDLTPLFVGKIAVEHISIVRELTWRGVLEPPPLIPRYMNRPDSLARIDRLRSGVGVTDLLERAGT